MENVGDLSNVCDPLAPNGLAGSYTCALVYNGDECQGVIHAMSLMSTLLNCVEELQGKRGLLICKSSSWKEAADSLGRSMTDCFEDCSFPCSFLYEQDGSTPSSRDALDRLLRHCFRSDSTECKDNLPSNHKGALSQATEYDLCSQMSNTSLHTFCTMQSPATGFSGFERNRHLIPSPGRVVDNYANMQKLLAMEKKRENKLKRLIVRFVDEVPSELIENDEEKKTSTAFNKFVEPGMEMKWNYIQAANEIAFHPDDIGAVVIVGLASVRLHGYYIDGKMSPPGSGRGLPSDRHNEYMLYDDRPLMHPFDSYMRPKWEVEYEEEGSCVAYQHRHISLYAFALHLTLNAAQANLDRLSHQNKCLPKLFIMESLPSKEMDQEKFIAFLRNRFQFTYKLE